MEEVGAVRLRFTLRFGRLSLTLALGGVRAHGDTAGAGVAGTSVFDAADLGELGDPWTNWGYRDY
ncbi:MAG TPA: hypothetical protein VMN36_01560 [Verrucomicrobiales bacterium]|nr:hypothetical protein [Verrucomicrobiales bacterium]